MATYLELCQQVARESGTITGVQPTTVEGQTGRLAKIVAWVDLAWREIQNRHAQWRWMREDWSANLTAGTDAYTAASFSIARFADWLMPPAGIVSIFDPALGVADEIVLPDLTWPEWRRLYRVGEQTADRPLHVAVKPTGEIVFGPKPDKTYTVAGEYRKAPQTLAANGDVPEMPARFHDLIAWRALLLLAEHDEAEGGFQIGIAQRRSMELIDDLERDQLLPVRLPGPLA